MSSENVYSAPQSDVTPVFDTTSEIEIFPRMSAWMVFFLALPTFGFYPAYWLYSRTKLMDGLPNRTCSVTLAAVMVVCNAAALVLSILSNFYKEIEIVGLTSGVISLVGGILGLVTAFALRRELRTIIASSGVGHIEISGVLTFFFQAIYLQYKINQCIDERNSQ